MELPLNLDFTIRLVINTQELKWQSSPVAGVERILLEREHAESGRATSLVRFAPNSFFDEHIHHLGEEIFVLSGEFIDEHGVHPAGTYLRNPVGSRHRPGSKLGCTLLVKLGHFQNTDTESLVLRTHEMPWLNGRGELEVLPLHSYGSHHTALVKWPRGASHVAHTHFGGEEIFVLEGVFQDDHGNYPAGTWLRNPHLSNHSPFSENGCVIFVKVGHL